MARKIIRDLGPGPRDRMWKETIGLLQASDTVIGHIDTGLYPHPALGYDDAGNPPSNILLDKGLNVFDPKPGDTRPVTDMSISEGQLGGAVEYPDHGVKTLSMILGNRKDKLTGAAPGATILPYRIANGPVFFGKARTGNIGKAMLHAMRLPNPPKVFTISMGNPGFTGFPEFFRGITGGSAGMEEETVEAVNRAYEAGIITVAAAGQIISTVVYPARFARTIAVGGITAGEAHYPPRGYEEPARVDAWAYATGINRAAVVRDENGDLKQIYADDPLNSEEASGTSYATPQVAAAAALWVTRWSQELAALPERWMIVESFRKALRESADQDIIRLRPTQRDTINIRRLNTEALLGIRPEADGLRKRDKATRLGSYL